MSRTFVAVEGEGLAQRVFNILEETRGENETFLTKILEPGEIAKKEDIALVEWTREGNGLSHNFPGKHIRIPSKERIVRAKLPKELAQCERVVFVRDASQGRDNSFPDAIYNMGVVFQALAPKSLSRTRKKRMRSKRELTMGRGW
mgnify:CR=1 FL=1|jgi:hypothetical protein